MDDHDRVPTCPVCEAIAKHRAALKAVGDAAGQQTFRSQIQSQRRKVDRLSGRLLSLKQAVARLGYMPLLWEGDDG